MKHVTTNIPCYMLSNGRLVKVTRWWLENEAAAALEAMRNAYQAEHPGEKFVISSAGRTHAEQVRLKHDKPTLAATPGRSYHEAGRAIDVAYSYMIGRVFKSQAALEAFMLRYGFHRTVKREPWHFEFWTDASPRLPVTQAIAYIGNNV